MDWLQFVVQWLHVLLGITWFGYAISMFFLVSPALAQLPEPELRAPRPVRGQLHVHDPHAVRRLTG